MLAWLYWNPRREIFTIPYLDQPIVWYGVLFALGFLVTYYVFLVIARRFFSYEPFFVFSDVKEWSRLLISLKNKKEESLVYSFLNSLPDPLREKILRWDLTKEIDEGFQKSILFGLNHFIEQSGKLKKERREELEMSLSCSLNKLSAKIRFLGERLFFYGIFGGVLGARLGHVFFYENISYYLENPLRILKTWEGGLSSHGGFLGIVFMFLLFRHRYKEQYPSMTFQRLCDFTAVGAALAAVFIRLGNFFNQEILGRASVMPWAIIFGSPADGGSAIPRHPAQLYEALFYFVVFCVLFKLKNSPKILMQPGKLSGLAFFFIFLFRVFIEFFKENQSVYDGHFFNMGQILSFPFLALGAVLFFSDRLLKKSMHILFSQKTY